MAQIAEFADYFAQNQGWLRPFAAFCVLKGLFGTAEHWNWGALSTPTPEVLALLEHGVSVNRLETFPNR